MNILLGLLMFLLAWFNIDAALDPANTIAWLSWFAAGFSIVVGVNCILLGFDDDF